MKLREQQIIIIAIPLVFEIALVGFLLYTLRQSNQDALNAKLAKTVLIVSQDLIRNSGEELVSLALMQDVDSDFAYDRFAKFRELRRKNYNELIELGNANKQIKQAADEVADASDLIQGYLDECERASGLGNRLDTRENLAQCKIGLPAFLEKVDRLTAPFRGLEKLAKERQEKALRTMEWLLWSAVFLSVLLAGLLVFGVYKGVLTRLRILMENISRLSNSEELLQPLNGTDEIASIDQTFHRMAGVIKTKTDEVKESEGRVRSVLEGLPLGVLVTDSNLNVRYANSRAGSYVNSVPEELNGCVLSDLVGTGKLPDFLRRLPELPTSEDIVRIEDSVFHRGDVSLPVEVTIVALNEKHDSSYIASILDITERKLVEQMRSDLMAMLTHDLRTPLTAMQVNLDLLASSPSGELSERAVRLVESDRRNCKRLISLVNELLDVEKVESGSFELFLELCDARGLFDESVAAVESIAESRALSIEVSLDDEAVQLLADRDRLIRVLINLLSNALKFSPPQGIVSLSGETVGDYFQIVVADRGPGIPEHMLDAVFEKYVQADNRGGKEQQGTGLGLAIGKVVVEAHRGTIRALNRAGGGSQFEVCIPLPHMWEESEATDGDE